MNDEQTLCWSCNKSYKMSSQTCPECGATNGNHDLYLAKAECDNPSLIVSPEKARLIAAAPELLAALQAMFNEHGDFDFTVCMLNNARAAISKATGSNS